MGQCISDERCNLSPSEQIKLGNRAINKLSPSVLLELKVAVKTAPNLTCYHSMTS